LVTATEEILPSHNFRVRAKFVRVLTDRGVALHLGRPVVRVVEGGVDERDTQEAHGRRAHRLELEGDGHLDVDDVLWVTTARAAPWPGESGFRVDDRGFIEVSDTLQTVTDPDVFAAGDVAAVVDHPRPKAGVFAVRQGPPLTANLRAHVVGERTVPFHPQEQFLSLISTGDRHAVASRGEWAAEGAWVWRWKDRIDRRFMRAYAELPDMEPEEGGSEMRCGGCGAKVGPRVLSRVLAQLEPLARDDVIVGIDAPDDAAVIEIPAGKQIVQTTDFFRAFIEDPYVFGRVAANHALGDVYAMGAEPRVALATVVMPHGHESNVEADLLQLLGGAIDTLNAEGTALVGGHTAEGAELSIGFAVTGLIDAGRARGKGGLHAGDGLILTKALGSGALFAADMRGRSKGRWIEAALRSMMYSNRRAAACLIEHGASALTDVTGFGLLGHAAEMAAASGTSVTVALGSLPVLEGTLEVMGAGIFSSLQAANQRLSRVIVNEQEASTHAAYAVLFDPQTAGGLLAGVPGANVDACVNALRALGYGAATAIGTVGDGRAEVDGENDVAGDVRVVL
jgi:selenide,water dikinase